MSPVERLQIERASKRLTTIGRALRSLYSAPLSFVISKRQRLADFRRHLRGRLEMAQHAPRARERVFRELGVVLHGRVFLWEYEGMK